MDRIAIALIASGLVLILAIVGAVVGGAPTLTLSAIAALGATMSGAGIVAGLVMLERRNLGAARIA